MPNAFLFMVRIDGPLPEYGYSYRRNTVSLAASLRASYPLEARIALNFVNSPLSAAGLRHANCPPGRLFSPKWVPSVLEGATREKFFLLSVPIL